MFFGKLAKNFAWELVLFRKIRRLVDGLTLCNIDCDVSWYKGDHQPSLRLHVVVCNITIVEFGIYNVNHVNCEDEDS